ncbi:Uncharacterised protein [Mycobacteroides abscessus subsp. abscessus]|nr:Uncharacterised protein [Mycobacteroides abscessus subsp. abscessus]
MPAASAACVCSPVSASSTAMFPLGRPTAISATRTPAPVKAASTLTAAPPASMLRTIWAVTDAG